MTMYLNTTVEIKAVVKNNGLPVAVKMEHWGKTFYVPMNHALIEQIGIKGDPVVTNHSRSQSEQRPPRGQLA